MFPPVISQQSKSSSYIFEAITCTLFIIYSTCCLCSSPECVSVTGRLTGVSNRCQTQWMQQQEQQTKAVDTLFYTLKQHWFLKCRNILKQPMMSFIHWTDSHTPQTKVLTLFFSPYCLVPRDFTEESLKAYLCIFPSAVCISVFYLYLSMEWSEFHASHSPTPPVLMGNVRHVLSVETAYCIWGYSGFESLSILRPFLVSHPSGSVV